MSKYISIPYNNETEAKEGSKQYVKYTNKLWKIEWM
jgi:hypothetical protein